MRYRTTVVLTFAAAMLLPCANWVGAENVTAPLNGSASFDTDSASRVDKIAPSLIAMIAAASPQEQADAIIALTDQYNRAKTEEDECQQAILAATLAEAHRHAASNLSDGKTTADPQKQQDILVAGSRWTSTALGHMAKADASAEFRTYFAGRAMGLLSLHVWFAERLSSPAAIEPVPDSTLKQLASLGTGPNQSSSLEAALSRYRSDMETLAANGAESKPIRELIERLVSAYNKKDTASLQGLFVDASPLSQQLKEKTAQEIIPATEWTFEKCDVKRITVQGTRANIELVVQYKSRDGQVSAATDCTFEARKGTDNAWKLVD